MDQIYGKATLLHDKHWDAHQAHAGTLAPWLPGEFLSPPVNDAWCRPTLQQPWALQLMMLDTDGDQWVFRRDPTVRGPLDSIGIQTEPGLVYLRPEIQLLYKARPEIQAKDQSDFELVLPLLAPRARAWLLVNLEKRFTTNHPWIRDLRKTILGRFNACHTRT